MKKSAALAMALALPLAALAACTTSNQTAGTGAGAPAATAAATVMQPTKKTTPLTIAYVPVVMNTSYQMVLNGIQEEIDRTGGDGFAKIVTQAPTGNASTLQEQSNILENLTQQNVDAIALATEDQDAMAPYIKAASEKGIPVFLFNMAEVSKTDPYYVTNVSFDQYGASHQIGEWAVDRFQGQDVEVAVLEGFPGIVNTQRLNGFKDAIAASPNLKLVASQPANWTRADGQTVTENILQAHPNVKFIYGEYDEMALGAVAAIKAAGKSGQVTVAGYDNTQDGYQAIKNGDLQATVDTASKQMGVELVKAIKSFVVDGQPVERSIMATTKVYDADNIDTFDQANYVYVPQGK